MENRAKIILENYAAVKAKDVGERMIRAEAQFSINFEMTISPLDFFIRRTGRLYFDIDSVREYMSSVMEEFQKAYGYTDAEMKTFQEKLEEELDTHSNFSLERH